MDDDTLKKRFYNGTWYGYYMEKEDNEDLCMLSPIDILKKTKCFDDKYVVKKQYFCRGSEICFSFHIEQKESQSKKNQTKRKHRQVLYLKILVSLGDQLLFCHRRLPNALIGYFEKIFEIDNLKLLNLTGSSPDQLILLYKQSRMGEKYFEFCTALEQRNNLSMDLSNDIYSEIGPSFEGKVPKIKKVECVVDRAPVSQELQHLEFNKVKVKFTSSKGVFGIYHKLAEKSFSDGTPPWIKNIRDTGKTIRRLMISN